MNSLLPQRGAAMVEFAIVVPLLVILVFGIVELGRALYQENTLSKAVAAAGRYMARSYGAINQSPTACTDGTAWSTAVAKAQNLAVYGNEDGTGTPLLPNLDAAGAVSVSHSATPEDLGGSITPACVITVTAQANFDAIFGDSIVPLLHLGPITLNARTEERYLGE